MKRLLLSTLVVMATLNSAYAMEKDTQSELNQLPHDEIVGMSIQGRITIQGTCVIDHDIFLMMGVALL